MLRPSVILLLCVQMAGFTAAKTITPSSRVVAFEDLHTSPVQSEAAGVLTRVSNASFASTNETAAEELSRTESNPAVSTADQAIDVSLEPASANLPPTVPLNLVKGAKRGQPFSFTYEQLIAGPPTDPEQDPLSDLRVYPSSLPLTLNGTPVTASGAVIRPGDIFGTMPGPTAVGNVPLLIVIVRDPWSSYAPTAFMRVETPFEEWVQFHFTPGESADPAVSGPNADPDGDGVSNVFEFLNGRLPKAVESESLVSISRPSTGPSSGDTIFRFNHLANYPEGTTLYFTRSSDLQNWTTLYNKIPGRGWYIFIFTPASNITTLPLSNGRAETTINLGNMSGVTVPDFYRLEVVLP